MNILVGVFCASIEILLLAIIMDILIGEPPVAVHPVVWMGKGIKSIQGLSFNNKKMLGILLFAVITGTSFLAGVIIAVCAPLFPETISQLIAAFFLKSTFSFRMLLASAGQIKNTIDAGNLKAVKKDLKMFVSRDTAGLDKNHMASAVIESLSENFVDAILSPLFYYLILGLPGALAYKAVNTLDSMVGYKVKDLIEIGRVSAISDDILNWIPARLSLLFIVAASVFIGSPVNAVKVCKRDRNLTLSPNSGLPMAAAAGALEVKLEKQGEYILGKEFKLPDTGDIERSIKLIGIAAIFLFLCTAGGVYCFSDDIWK
jgi:adenosylcobinamide-phosphate synthase